MPENNVGNLFLHEASCRRDSNNTHNTNVQYVSSKKIKLIAYLHSLSLNAILSRTFKKKKKKKKKKIFFFFLRSPILLFYTKCCLTSLIFQYT